MKRMFFFEKKSIQMKKFRKIYFNLNEIQLLIFSFYNLLKQNSNKNYS